MFDTLTEDEREALSNKLANWGHASAEIGRHLSYVSLAAADRAAAAVLWIQRDRYYDVMDEMYALRLEVLAA